MGVKLSRRSLIGAALGCLGLAGTAAWLGAGSVEHLVERVLARHLPGIRIAPATVRTYTAELRQYSSVSMQSALTILSLVEPAYPVLSLLPLRAIRDFEHRVVVDLLLSSDFFRDVRVQERQQELTYAGFHWRRPACSNPFAILG
jgi:hypothetical protein